MARKRKRRSRSRAVVRRSSARGASSTVARPRRRSRARSFVARFRPTRGGLRSVVPFTMNATIGAAEVMGGVIIARKARGFAKLAPGTPFAMVAEFAAGIVAGMIVSRFNAQAGERVAIGGVLAPMMTAVQRLSIPHVSDALGDDGYVLDGGLTLDDASGVAGYVAGANAGGIAGYVPGRDWASA